MVCCEKYIQFFSIIGNTFLGITRAQGCFQLADVFGALPLFEEKHMTQSQGDTERNYSLE